MSHLPLKFMLLGKIKTSEGKLVVLIGLIEIIKDFSNNPVRIFLSVGWLYILGELSSDRLFFCKKKSTFPIIFRRNFIGIFNLRLLKKKNV